MKKIAIVGSGLIGQNWAMIFASVGYKVTLFDIDPNQLSRSLSIIQEKLELYAKDGSLRGELTSAQQRDLISGCTNLAECIEGAFYLQECVPENVELKRKVFKDIDECATEDLILASSSSCINASQFSDGLKHKENVLIAHPVNPPYFVPLVELVPSPWTKPKFMDTTRKLLEEVGQSPITLQRESPGFALNRIQYAIINECWSMYKSGLLSAEDIDKVMSDGMGPRYAFIGPFETMHLNADGIVDYCKRYADGAVKVQKTFELPPIQYDIATAKKIQEEFSETMPLEKLSDRRQRRDNFLISLAKLKKGKTD